MFHLITALGLVWLIAGATAADDSLTEVRGKVVDEQGRPVAGAVVSALYNQQPPATTDPQGSFALKVKTQAGVVPALLARDESGKRQGFFASNNPEAPVSEARIVLRKARELPVTVVDAQSRPLSGATVAAMSLFRQLGECTTDADGQATVRVPSDMVLQCVYALKPGVGLDYFLFRDKERPVSEPYSLPADHAAPLTFTLAGVRPIRVQVNDGQQQPLAGVQVSPWYIELPKKGGIFNLGGLEQFSRKTDSAGLAEFDFIPAANTAKINFWARKEGYCSPKRHIFDPAGTVNDVAATLVKQVRVTGKVLDPQSKPAAGIMVSVVGSGYGFDDFRGGATTEADGTFSLLVDPDKYYAFNALHDRLISSPQLRVVRADKQAEPVELVLRPGTRVFGTLTVGSEPRPLAGRHVVLYREENSYYQLPKEQRLPNPDDSRKAISPYLSRPTQADDQGKIEFFAAPGTYYLTGIAGARPPKFEITDQEEVDVSFHIEQKAAPVLVTGRVVLRADPKRAVAEAVVQGDSVSQDGSHFRAISDSQGKFSGKLLPFDMLVYAKSPDGLLAGIAKRSANAIGIEIPIGPTATARGRLVDDSTGKLMAEQIVEYGVEIKHLEGTFSTNFGGRVSTDSEGQFVLPGLAVGWEYQLRLVVETGPDGQPRAWRRVTTVKPETADLVEMGEVRVPPGYRPPTLEQLIERVMPAKPAATERMKTRLRDARLAEQQVLLFVAPKGSDVSKQFFTAYYGLDRDESPKPLREVLGNFALLAVDTSEGARSEAQELAAAYKLPLPDEESGLFAVINAKGELVAAAASNDLLENETLSITKLRAFLEEKVGALPDAEELLENAYEVAKRDGKRVLIQVSGPFCAPCVLLTRYLDKHRDLIAKDYVYVKLDARFINGLETIRNVRTEEGGIPWMVILDAAGKPLITSTAKGEGNIGFPSTPEGIAHFEKMLRSTTQRLTDSEIESLVKDLTQ